MPSNNNNTTREQVNAWASYEQTGASARHLGQPRQRRSRKQKVLDQKALQQYDLTSVQPKETTEKWNAYFQRLDSLDEHATAQMLQWDDEDEEDIEQQQEQSLRLLGSVRDHIRSIFGVFFQGAHSHQASAPSYRSMVNHEKNQENDEEPHHHCSDRLSHTLAAWDGTMPGAQPWIQQTFGNDDNSTSSFLAQCLLFVEYNLRGVAQVYFQNNPLSGACIVAGLLVQNVRVALHGVISLTTANVLATLLGFDGGLQASGLFGYNAVLVGLALATFDTDWHAATVLGSVVFGGFSLILFMVFGKLLNPYKVPPLTFPFNVATIIFLLATYGFGRADHFASVRPPALPDYDATSTGQVTVSEFFKATLRGVGQVFLADDLLAGFLILIGITLCSRIAAMAAFCGSALGNATALLVGTHQGAILGGLYGYNASLSCAAMLMFYAPEPPAVVLGILASLITTLTQVAVNAWLEPYGLPAMTVPFCLVALPFLLIQGTTSKIIAIPLAAMTVPEDHWKKVNALKYGFSLLQESIHPIPTRASLHSGTASERMSSNAQLNRRLSQISKTISARHYHHTASLSEHKNAKDIRHHHKLSRHETLIVEQADAIFNAIDTDGHLGVKPFVAALKAAGLTDPEGLRFAVLVFGLLDLDNSHSIEKQEFETFCLVSQALLEIRYNSTKFIDFVDANGDGDVTFDEIDAALAYLGEPTLTEQDRSKLSHVVGHDDEDGMDAVELINFVLVAAIKHLVEVYHENTTVDRTVPTSTNTTWNKDAESFGQDS